MPPLDGLALQPPLEPMEAKPSPEIPRGTQWLYEPKWDGFRCIAFRDGETIAMQSKSGQPLERYFPEIVQALQTLPARRYIIDGELVIEQDGALDFDALLQRIHPAQTRITKLSRETPATYALFDLLQHDRRKHFEAPLRERRAALEKFADEQLSLTKRIGLSPATTEYAQAERWLKGGAAWFDGVVAKRNDASYRFGERDAAVKVKRVHTADCVVGGFRFAKDGKTIGSLLLGLYDGEGLLHLVGFVGSMSAQERQRAAAMLVPIIQEPGFTGARPGGVSRWGSRDTQWHPVAPRIVVEVRYDRVTGHRFRHGARLVRWRPDKAPQQCTMAQVAELKKIT